VTSFDVLESSAESSVPIEVYELAIGNDVYRYTSTEDPITLGANTYSPEEIERGSLAQGQEERSRLLEITLPMLNPFAVRYLNVVPGERAEVTIIQLQRNEVPTFDTQLVRYRGRVRSVRYDDEDNAVLGCQSLEFALSRTIPNFVYSGLCNWFLYGSGCGADPASHSLVSALVTNVSGNVITVDGVSGSGKNFVGGYCKMTSANDFRMVIAQSGNLLTLLLPFAVSPLGGTVDVYEGCDHDLLGDCEAKFGRGLEFGGFYYVPKKNVFRSAL
jgi:hypothetical protein